MNKKESILEKIKKVVKTYNGFIAVLFVFLIGMITLFAFSKSDLRYFIAAVSIGSAASLPFMFRKRADALTAYYEFSRLDSDDIYKLPQTARKTVSTLTRSRGRGIAALLGKIAAFVICAAISAVILFVIAHRYDIYTSFDKWATAFGLAFMGLAAFAFSFIIAEAISNIRIKEDEE